MGEPVDWRKVAHDLSMVNADLLAALERIEDFDGLTLEDFRIAVLAEARAATAKAKENADG